MSEMWTPTLEEIAGAFAEHESVYKGVEPTDAKRAFWRSMVDFTLLSPDEQYDTVMDSIGKFEYAAERQKEYINDKD